MQSILAQFPVVTTFIRVRESTSPFIAWSTKRMQKLEFIFSNTCTIDRLHRGLNSKNGIAPLVPLIIRGVIDRLNMK